MAASATQPTSYLSDPNATSAYQTALAGAADIYNQNINNTPYYGADEATKWANTVPGLLAPQTPYQVNAASEMGKLQGYMGNFTTPATGYASSSAVPINTYQVGQSQIDQYMSPYLNNVMSSAVQNINETNNQQQQQLMGNAISKGAWGGDRAGIAAAALARQQNLSNNATLANILNTGYGQALGEANQQQGVAYGAQIANNQMNNAAATLYNNLGTQGQAANIQQLQSQYNMGAAQQAQDQNAKNIAYQQYQNFMQNPYQQNKYLADIASGAASAMGGTTVASIPQPSTVSQIAGSVGALAGADYSGVSNLFKNRGGSVRGGYAAGGRPQYAEAGAVPSAGDRLTQTYNAYTQAARAGADLGTLKALYNDYITVKNATGPGGTGPAASALGNQIRSYVPPTAASLEKDNNSSAGGVAAIAGMIAKLLASQSQQKKGGSGGGSAGGKPAGTNIPPSKGPETKVPVNQATPNYSGDRALQTLAGPTGMGNTATANQYLSTLSPTTMNSVLGNIAAVPHVMPASVGGQNMPTAGAFTTNVANPYSFATAARTLDANGNLLPNAVNNLNASPVAYNKQFIDANNFPQSGITTTNPANAGVGNISSTGNAFNVNGISGVAQPQTTAQQTANSQFNPYLNLGNLQQEVENNLAKLEVLAQDGKISPTEYLATRGQMLDQQSSIDKAMTNQANAMDQRDLPTTADILATEPQSSGGFTGMTNQQAMQQALDQGLGTYSPDQLVAMGYSPDQAMAIAGSNAMPPADVVERTTPALSFYTGNELFAPISAPQSNATAQAWNQSYDDALANGLSSDQAAQVANQIISTSTAADPTTPVYTDSRGDTVDAIGNPTAPTVPTVDSQPYQPYEPGYPTNPYQPYEPEYPTNPVTPTVPYVDDGTPYIPYVPEPIPSTPYQPYEPNYPEPTPYEPSPVEPYNPYIPDPIPYQPYEPYEPDYPEPYIPYDPGPSIDYGDYQRGGGVHRHPKAVGGANMRQAPESPYVGISPISMNYGMPSSAYLQNQAESVAGAGVVPVTTGMQALAAKDYGFYAGGVVRHHRR